MVAMSAEYRVKSRNGTTPAECVKDGKSAMRWIRQHAGELGIDANRLAAGGGSAGGQVAAALAALSGFNEAGEDLGISCLPAALVLFNPVIDNGPDGYGHSRVKEFWQTFSPLHNIHDQMPPTVFFLGTNDKHIPVGTAETYRQRMAEGGRRCDLHVYEGRKHGFFNYTHADDYAETVAEMDRFLVSLGFLQPQP
jgi:acetyl esterase/lipase